MSYNIIPAELPDLPLSIPVLTGIAITLIFILYLLTLMPRRSKFVVNDRTVVITGGSQGMGKGLAKLLAKKGAHVVIVARDVKRLEAALEEIKASAVNPSKQRFHFLSADLTNPEESVRIISEVTTWNHDLPPDIVWANAGSAHPTLFLQTPIQTLRSQMDTNYWATAYLAHATLTAWTQAPPSPSTSDPPPKLPRHFITTSSVLAFCGIAGYAPYSPPKSAQRSLIDTLRSEIALYNGARLNADVPTPEIKLHAVFPGTIRSPGHAQEQTLKHPITGILEEGDPTQSEDEVALAAVKGLEKGDFLVATQGLGALLRWGSLGSSARNGWVGFRDVLGSSMVSVIWCFLGPQLEGKVFAWGKKNGVRPDARMKDGEH